MITTLDIHGQIGPFTGNISQKGEVFPVDRDEGHPGMYALGATVTVLSVAGYVAPFFIAFPLAAPIQIVALGVLTAVSYGIINDQLACRQCIEYFTVGHTRIHQRLLKTEDPTLNGVVWGIHATWELGLIAGVALAVATRATKMVALSALSLTPAAILLVIGACTYAHIKSKQAEAEWSQPSAKFYLKQIFNQVIKPEEGYHPVDLSRISEDKRAAYMGVGERNRISFTVMPAAGAALIVGSIALRVILTLAL
jgi:hypothetical protein